MLTIFQTKGPFTSVLSVAVVVVVFTGIVFMEQAQRRVPVQYAKRMVGRRMYGGTSTYIPLKVNQAGVIPVIFASSLLYIPQLALQLMDQNHPNTAYKIINNYIVNQSSSVYISLY